MPRTLRGRSTSSSSRSTGRPRCTTRFARREAVRSHRARAPQARRCAERGRTRSPGPSCSAPITRRLAQTVDACAGAWRRSAVVSGGRRQLDGLQSTRAVGPARAVGGRASRDQLPALAASIRDGRDQLPRRAWTAASSRAGCASLRRIHDYYAALAGLGAFPAVRCNAPWVSAVLEPGGQLRPCFFHAAYPSPADASFEDTLNAPAALAFRGALDVSTNETCQRCVCSLSLPLWADA